MPHLLSELRRLKMEKVGLSEMRRLDSGKIYSGGTPPTGLALVMVPVSGRVAIVISR